MRIEIDDITRPEVLALLEEHLRNMYELSPPEHVFAFDASKLRAPGVVFWTAWQDDALLGCAALKELSRTQGEIKSMRTPASRRRHGAGRTLLDHILHVSRERGYQELFLESGRHPAFEPAHTRSTAASGSENAGRSAPTSTTATACSCRSSCARVQCDDAGSDLER